MPSIDNSPALSPSDTNRIKSLVSEHGLSGAARLIGISKTAILRATSGLPMLPSARVALLARLGYRMALTELGEPTTVELTEERFGMSAPMFSKERA